MLPRAEARRRLDAAMASMLPSELEALFFDWPGTWARENQIIPTDGPWRTFGYCGGRGMGKTRPLAEFVNAEAEAGRARRIALISQNEDNTIAVQVLGESGLIACSPPWFRARYENGRVVWPNGAQAFIYTPFEPGNIRGPEHHLVWASEFVAWPVSTRQEALDVLEHGLRLGYARMVWDTTPKRRHPIVRYLLARGAANPEAHVVVRGSTRDNAVNLAPGRVAELVAKFGATQKGREEIEGEYLDDDEGALWRQSWIDDNRRDMPALVRRILVVDPAISDRKGTDDTGIGDYGQDAAGQVYVIADLTARHGWDEWGELIVSRYFAQKCDLVIVERNRGGDACVANLRSAAKSRVAALRKLGVSTPDVEVVILKDKDKDRPHEPGKMWVREVIGRESKGARAAVAAAEYEAGRVSHVNGAELTQLEDRLTTWEPEKGGESPNAIDVLAYGVTHLAKLGVQPRDHSAGFVGLPVLSKALAAAVGPRAGTTQNVASLIGSLGRSEWGSKI